MAAAAPITTAAAAALISRPKSLCRSCRLQRGTAISHGRRALAFFGIPINNAPPTALLLSRSREKRRRVMTLIRRVSPFMEWQDCRAELEVDVPSSVAYDCYSDRESIPAWMPFISSVKILNDKPDLSRWSLKYEFLGRDVEFSWLARNLQPIRNQKIHWRSLEGLPNKGAVRFYPKGPSSCKIELTVSYEIPQILSPVASVLKPFLEGLLQQGLERFATFAKNHQSKMSKT